MSKDNDLPAILQQIDRARKARMVRGLPLCSSWVRIYTNRSPLTAERVFPIWQKAASKSTTPAMVK